MNILGILKKKEWPKCQREKERAVGKYARAVFCQKEKEQNHQSRIPNRKGRRSQGEREPHLGERKKEIGAGAWGGKGGLHSEGRGVPRR